MSTVLVLDSSLTGEASVTKSLIQDVLSELRAGDPGLRVILRDLAAEPLPHLTLAVFAEPDGAARRLSDALIAELQAADTVVIGVPMYNFGIPSTLKAWFDYVLRAGVTFRYTEAGPEGLVKGKRAIAVSARGGLYGEEARRALDAQEPHLRTMLRFMGIDDVTVVRAEGLSLGAEAREGALKAARAEIRRLGGAEQASRAA